MLAKSFQDYFRIPILLRPLCQTPRHLLTTLADTFNQNSANLYPDYTLTAEVEPKYAKMLAERGNNAQRLFFLTNDFTNDWPEFEIIYKCRFVIAVCQPSKEGDLFWEALERMKKQLKEDNIKLIGIIFTSEFAPIEKITGTIFTIIPKGLQNADLWSFMEPWIYSCLQYVEGALCACLDELQQEDNGWVVFNRFEEKSEPKVMKKKRKARCIKLCGDICLMLGLPGMAYKHYEQAEEILKKAQDFLWQLGCVQGKVGCFTAELGLVDEQQKEFQHCIEEAFGLAQKTRLSVFETENFFKIVKLFRNQPPKFDGMLLHFTVTTLPTFSQRKKLQALLYISWLYRQAGLQRKANYYDLLATQLGIMQRLGLRRKILEGISKSKFVKEWTVLYSKVLKLLINEGEFSHNPSGLLELELLEECYSGLSDHDIQVTISSLNYGDFNLFNLQKLRCLRLLEWKLEESAYRPKLNRFNKAEPQQMVFIGWKKQRPLLYEKGEPLRFSAIIQNNMHFRLNIFLSAMANQIETGPVQFKLKHNSQNRFSGLISLPQTKEECVDIQISFVKIRLWHFTYMQKLSSPIKIEIYEKQPKLQIEIPEVVTVQASSYLRLKCLLLQVRDEPCVKAKLNITCCFDEEIGFQENEFMFTNQMMDKLLEKRQLRVQILESQEPKPHAILQNTDNQIYIGSQKDKKSHDWMLSLRLRKFKEPRIHLRRFQLYLAFIKSQHSKYEVCKQWNVDCKIERCLNFRIQGVQSPYSQSVQNDTNYSPPKETRFVEPTFEVTVCIQKDKEDHKVYQIKCQDGKQCILSGVTSQITHTFQKIKRGAQLPVMRYCWRDMLNSNRVGEITVAIPKHRLAYQSEKKVQMGIKFQSKQQTIVHYKLSGSSLDHRFLLRCANFEIERKYVLNGKTRCRTEKSELNNMIQVTLKGSANYYIGLCFDDGEVYWHHQALSSK